MLLRSQLVILVLSLLSISIVVQSENTNSDGTEIILDLDKIQQLGNADVMLRTISKLTLALNNCGVDVRGMKELRRVMLPSTSYSRCMDGSNAGYYIRKKTGSSRWLVYLEGGMYCFDKKSCRSRSMNTPNLTSSDNWPLTREGSGILSWNPEENPLMFSANIVFIPYCSSDAWSGNNTKNGMYFHGSTIIEEVITDLVERQGLGDHSLTTKTPAETKLFFTGSSAGATGVLLNIDKVAQLISELKGDNSNINVFGVVDSGWFIDTEQFIKGSCTNTLNCSPAESVTKGFRLWKPQMPKRCRRAYSEEPWRCFFGYRIYPYIQRPLFVITYLYDRAQILASMGGGLSTYQEVQSDMYTRPNTDRTTYMRDLSKLINITLTNVSAVFAPSCMDHELLKRSMWHSVSIDGTSLVEALRCWEFSQQTNTVGDSSNTNEQPSEYWREVDVISDLVQEIVNLSSAQEVNRVRHSAGSETRDNRISKNRRRNRKRKQRKRLKNRIRQRLRMKRDIDDQDLIDAAIQNNLVNSLNENVGGQCRMRLFDECDTPNCNLRCPNYLSLFSSRENKPKTSLTNSYSPDISEIKNTVHDPTVLSEILSRQT